MRSLHSTFSQYFTFEEVLTLPPHLLVNEVPLMEATTPVGADGVLYAASTLTVPLVELSLPVSPDGV